jgi:hypothetical protein
MIVLGHPLSMARRQQSKEGKPRGRPEGGQAARARGDLVQVSVKMTTAMHLSVDRFRERKGYLTDAEAVRQLISMGLEQDAAARGEGRR